MSVLLDEDLGDTRSMTGSEFVVDRKVVIHGELIRRELSVVDRSWLLPSLLRSRRRYQVGRRSSWRPYAR